MKRTSFSFYHPEELPHGRAYSSKHLTLISIALLYLFHSSYITWEDLNICVVLLYRALQEAWSCRLSMSISDDTYKCYACDVHVIYHLTIWERESILYLYRNKQISAVGEIHSCTLLTAPELQGPSLEVAPNQLVVEYFLWFCKLK